jgi:flagellar biosynthesis protein FlhG
MAEILAHPEWSVDPLKSAAAPALGRVKQIWAIGGGKGGVGKSLISSSLAISLSRFHQKVVAVDLDLGGANLHTTLGVDLPQQSLSDFITNRVTRMDDCVIPTGIPNLSVISGAQDSIGVMHLQGEHKTRLLEAFRRLDADFVIFDLGAGTSSHTIDFFLAADVGMVTVLPEPTSIENAYRFIKSAFYRRLRSSPALDQVAHLIDAAMEGKNDLGIKTPSDLFREVNAVSPEAGLRMKELIAEIQPRLILNQVRTQTDIDVGFSIKSVCKRYFGIDLDYLGYLDYDSSVWQAVRRKKPFMVEFPNSRLVGNIDKITQYLFRKAANPAVPPR